MWLSNLPYTNAFLKVMKDVSREYQFEDYQRNATEVLCIGKQYTSLNIDILLNEFPDIETLAILNTSITDIPEEIGELTSLKHLNISDNNIRNFPCIFKNLINLHTLTLENNNLLFLPNDFKTLKKLKSLSLGNNRLRLLPSSLVYLESIINFDLQNNFLSFIPEYFRIFNNLCVLDLGNNKIKTLPSVMVHQLQHTILFLNMCGNPMSHVGNNRNYGIWQIKKYLGVSAQFN